MTPDQGTGCDAFYTPTWLAREVAACLPDGLRGAVFDPTVGGGSLLSAVCERFGSRVTALGIDIDTRTVAHLRSLEPEWTVSRADLLSAKSRNSSHAWRAARTGIAAVVVNPPFSYRGQQGVEVSFGGFRGRVAPAMHFLVELLNNLAPEVGFYAILPDGALDADKHRTLWGEIQDGFAVDRLRSFKTTSFQGARASTSLIRLRNGATTDRRLGRQRTALHDDRAAAPRDFYTRCRCVEVVRGRLPVHRVKSAGEPPSPAAPFVHTTSLSRMGSLGDLTASAHLGDDAPLILLTRVGRWSSPVVVDIGRIVLSDCLFGLRPRDRSELENLRKDLERSRATLTSLFKGTGAKYVTLSALVTFIEQMGWHPHIVKAGAQAAECCCGHRPARSSGLRPAEHDSSDRSRLPVCSTDGCWGIRSSETRPLARPTV